MWFQAAKLYMRGRRNDKRKEKGKGMGELRNKEDPGVSREFLTKARNGHRAFSLHFLISKKRTPSVPTEFLNRTP
jgi:hypothetical protein